jgi:hypothetical protein
MLVGIALVVLALRAHAADATKSWLNLELEIDSIWGHSELSMFADEKLSARASLNWRDEDGPLLKADTSLSPADTRELRTLVRGLDPKAGQFWGKDVRGLDGPLVTLGINTDDSAVVLVCSGNPSFDGGPRKTLLERLMALVRKIQKEHDGHS